jgi:hypothetical protein
MTSAHQQILNTLAGKSSTKQAIYENTIRHFESIYKLLVLQGARLTPFL